MLNIKNIFAEYMWLSNIEFQEKYIFEVSLDFCETYKNHAYYKRCTQRVCWTPQKSYQFHCPPCT